MSRIIPKIIITLSAVALLTQPVIAFAQVGQTLVRQPAGSGGAGAESSCNIEGVAWLEGVGIADGFIIPCPCADSDPLTKCTLNHVFILIINLMKIILGVTGSAALLMFAYGGFMFIISSGNEERVKQAKDIVQMAATGLVIIFIAFLIVNSFINVLTTGDTSGPAQINDIGTFGEPPTAR